VYARAAGSAHVLRMTSRQTGVAGPDVMDRQPAQPTARRTCPPRDSRGPVTSRSKRTSIRGRSSAPTYACEEEWRRPRRRLGTRHANLSSMYRCVTSTKYPAGWPNHAGGQPATGRLGAGAHAPTTQFQQRQPVTTPKCVEVPGSTEPGSASPRVASSNALSEPRPACC